MPILPHPARAPGRPSPQGPRADPSRAMAQLHRDARLRQAGFEVVHFTWSEIIREPDQVAASIRAAFRRPAVA